MINLWFTRFKNFYKQEISMATRFQNNAIGLVLSLFMTLSFAADPKKDAPAADPTVKKSDTGICHDKTSPSYGNTKKFTAFASLDECVKSGGKPPANAPAAAAATPIIKKSDSGICHDSKSPHYERTKKFTEFKTVDECLKSGGKLPK
jgi:hypothetical protein